MIVLGGLAVFMGWELQAALSGGESLCGSSACTDASDALLFSATWIYATAGLWALGLMWTLPASRFQEDRLSLFALLLYAGVAFEGVLLGHLAKTGTPCTLCLIVGGAIASILILESIRSWRVGSAGVLIWCSAAMASMILVGGGSQAIGKHNLTGSAVMRLDTISAQTSTEFHLYVRYSCPHCARLISELIALDIQGEGGAWFLHIPERRLNELDARRIAYVQDHREMGLKCMLISKGLLHENLPEIPEDRLVTLQAKSALAAGDMDRFGMPGVPALIVQTPAIKVEVIGITAILDTLRLFRVIRE